ncbi:helix-turn-helix transcriptional regulator, partial [Pseudonocardia adelaidensis]|uniref:helix-turn-helix transcriptional regulator n=1 Tax=Pseudonocardia adelaidensis TaxID=648754 RepID=UPI0031E5359D
RSVSGEAQRRRELGEFLKARRQQIVRSELGLPPTGRRSALGLRREEISYLSGVSITWYTWLEQGRQIKPSRQVLEAIARTLRLSVTEQAYILSLAGHSAPEPAPEPPPQTTLSHVQRLLDALARHPAYAMAPDWTVVGWNAAYEALYPNVATAPPADRNLLWLVFTDPHLRELMADWDDTSRRLLARFRAQAGPRLGHPSFSRVVKRLLEASEAFRTGWENHDIEGFTPRERLFRHPAVGDLHMEQHILAPSDHPDLQVVIYTPVQTTDTPARLRRLVDT